MGIETIALASTIGSGIMNTVGSIAKGNAESAAAKYQAQVARNNVIAAQQNAEFASSAGFSRSQAADFRHRAELGTMEAAQAASYIDAGVGSPLAVRDSAHQIARLDTATIFSNALMESRQQTEAARAYEAQARLNDMQASNARTAGIFGAVGNILGTASSFGLKWAAFQGGGPAQNLDKGWATLPAASSGGGSSWRLGGPAGSWGSF